MTKIFLRCSCPRWFVGLCLVCGVVGGSVPLWEYLRTREGMVYTGFVQGDLPMIMALAREIFETGDGVTRHASPFDYRLDAPRIYSYGLTTLLGHLWHLTGWSPEIVFNTLGLLCAPVMLLLTWPLLSRALHTPSMRVMIALVLVFGGGWAIPLTVGSLLLRGEPFSVAAFGHTYLGIEGPFTWWFLNLFRNTLFATESFYHVLFLAAVGCYLRAWFWPCVVLVTVLAWAHPFTGVELLLILLASEGVYVLSRHSWHRARWLVTLSAIFGMLLAYNFLFLGSYAEHQELMRHWREARYTLQLVHEVAAYGPFLPLPLLGLIGSATLRRTILDSFATRFLCIWAVVVYVLINNEAWFEPPYEPAHFTRGYLFLPLVLLSGMVLEHARQLPSRWVRYGATTVLGGCLLVPVMDNALFLARFAHGGIPLMWNPATLMATYRRLEELPEPRLVAAPVLAQDHRSIGYWLSVWTKHRPVVGHYVTAGLREKAAVLRAFYEEGDFALLTRYPISVVLLPTEAPALATLEVGLARRGFRQFARNPDWQVWITPTTPTTLTTNDAALSSPMER
jgi:hypothetical protein